MKRECDKKKCTWKTLKKYGTVYFFYQHWPKNIEKLKLKLKKYTKILIVQLLW